MTRERSKICRARCVRASVFLLLAGALLGSAPLFSSDDETAPVAASTVTLDAFAFISGRWVGRSENGLIEEIWTEPEGDAMVGLFRMVSADRARFYEFQNIAIEDGNPVLRIKHFNPDMVGWEEKTESVVFTLRQVAGQTAVFDEVDAEVPTSLHFERTKDDKLLITLRKIRDGEARDSRFEFALEPFSTSDGVD